MHIRFCLLLLLLPPFTCVGLADKPVAVQAVTNKPKKEFVRFVLPPVSLGVYDMVGDSRYNAFLGLDSEQIEEAARLGAVFNEENKEWFGTTLRTARKIANDDDPRLKQLQKESTERNERIVAEMTKLLGRKKFRILRRVWLQSRITDWRPNEVLPLFGNYRLNSQQMHETRKQFNAIKVSASHGRFSYVTMLSFMVRKKYLTQAEVDATAGEPFDKVIVNHKGGIGPIFQPISRVMYQDTPIEMLVRPQVQVELGMTPTQATDVRELYKTLSDKYSQRAAQNLFELEYKTGADDDKVRKIFAKWRDEVKAELKKGLPDDQFKRLWELYFQFNARRKRLNWCRWIAGKKFDIDVRMGMAGQELQSEANYHHYAYHLKEGTKILAGVLGEETAERLVGEPEIMPGYFYFDNPKEDTKLRNQIKAEVFGKASKPISRRRER